MHVDVCCIMVATMHAYRMSDSGLGAHANMTNLGLNSFMSPTSQVGEAMTKEVISIGPNAPLSSAAALMLSKKVSVAHAMDTCSPRVRAPKLNRYPHTSSQLHAT